MGATVLACLEAPVITGECVVGAPGGPAEAGERVVSEAEREAGTYAIGQLFVALARMRERIAREAAREAGQ